MKTELKSLSPTKMELFISLSWEDISDDYTAFLRKFAKNIHIDGFRKGKAPAARVEKMYQYKIEYDFINEKFFDYYSNAVQETESQPVSEPSVTHYEFRRGSSLEFKVEFDIIPEWKLPELNSSVKIEKIEYKVTDKAVEDQLEHIRKDHAEVTPLDTWEEGAGIVSKFEELDDAGEPVPGRTQENFTVIPGEEPFTGKVMDTLSGIAVDESRTVTIKDLKGDGKDHVFRVTAKSYERRVLPELNDEFASVVDPNIEKIDELRDLIRKEYKATFEKNAKDQFRQDVITAVTDKAEDLLIPDSLVESYLDDLRKEQETSRNTQIDADAFNKANFEQARVLLKWELIRNKLIDDNSITVSDEEVMEHISTNMIREDEPNREMYLKYYSTPSVKKDISNALVNDRVFDFIEAAIKVKKVEKNID